MWENRNMPKFGCLQGVKVVHATSSMAGPFAAQLLADYGADVVWIESARMPDTTRTSYKYGTESERRNQRTISLDVASDKGKEVFKRLIADADVFIESSKGGQWEKWGLSDEVLWSINERLVICHVSGFGQTGVPEYVSRPSYDMVAQAFSGYEWINMNPDTSPYTVGPWAGDYFTGLFAAVGVLAALHRAQVTGKGESVDVAQYECMMRVQINAVDYFTAKDLPQFAGDPQPYAGAGSYKCKDGEYVQLSFFGAGVVSKACKFLGIDESVIPSGTGIVFKSTEGGKVMQEKLFDYFAEHDATEAAEAMTEAGLTAQKVNTYEDLLADPHVNARGIIEEVKSVKGVDVKFVGPVPKFVNNPAYTWRPAPYIGQDNDEILAELDFTQEDIKELRDEGIVVSDEEMLFTYPYKAPGRG